METLQGGGEALAGMCEAGPSSLLVPRSIFPRGPVLCLKNCSVKLVISIFLPRSDRQSSSILKEFSNVGWKK